MRPDSVERKLGKKPWLALLIGNSRWHWGYFVGDRLCTTWASPHRLPSAEKIDLLADCPLVELRTRQNPMAIYGASVVPKQAPFWQDDPCVQVLTLAHVPLQGLYDTLGIDRALAVLGLGAIAGLPALVIDGGTALTLTGIDGERRLVGGAILPGLSLQRAALHQGTAALPRIDFGETLPSRWATNTEGAIASGLVYGMFAAIGDFVGDWLARYPKSAIALTGGDAPLFYQLLQQRFPEYAHLIRLEPHLIFYGIREILFQEQRSP